MPKILSGKKIRDEKILILREKVASLAFSPHLSIIQVGKNEASEIYIREKKKFGESVGCIVEVINFPDNAREEEIISKIESLNADKSIHGIMVQLPLPDGMDKEKVLKKISPDKDVDGLSGMGKFVSATARGVMEILDYYKIPMKGKKALVAGMSDLVGKPVAKLLADRGAMVSSVWEKSENWENLAKEADILVSAVGKPGLVKKEMVKEGVVVVDIGISKTSEGKISGDVDFENVSLVASAITPVPGGVGPMTVLALFENLIESAEKKI